MNDQPAHGETPPVQPGLPVDAARVEDASQDLEQLRLLAIFYYVLGGLKALGACGVTFWILAGPALLAGAGRMSEGDPTQERALAATGWIITAFVTCAAVLAWTLVILMILTGLSLAAQRRRILCMVVACLILLSIPFGTILGVFTLVVLTRPSVRLLFERRAAELATHP